MEQFQILIAVVKMRPTANGCPLKDGTDSLNGRIVCLQALWPIEEDDARYPNEWALGPKGDVTKAAFDAAGLGWIASGDVVESIIS